MSKILCYELNEVPWRVVDFYLQQRPNSHFSKLLEQSAQFTTHTVDSGELHPWSTWPTAHRGVSNDVHNIRYLNQDLSSAAKYPPAWQLLADGGQNCGVFGSLQSFPPAEHENIDFHIPDTFAAGSSTIPMRCEPFQAFNLFQTGQNKAVSGSISVGHVAMAIGLLRTGIKAKTYAKVVKQLINEKRSALYKTRRALLQPELAFDVFLSCLKKNQPDYVTFFSNHVAGIMHRYWKYSFPEDFDYTLADTQADQFHSQSVLIAMDIFDSHIGELSKVAKRHDYNLVVMSSMGQEAIERGEYVPEVKLDNFQTLTKRLNIDYPVFQNLAMQPDVAFEFEAEKDLLHFKSALCNLLDIAGKPIFRQRLEPTGKTLNLSMRSSAELAADKHAHFNDEKIPLEALGLQVITRDIGTGYHQPEGILTWQNLKTEMEPRAIVDSRSFLPTLLQEFDIECAGYMQPAIQRAASIR